jgi:hypothetical protein
MNTCVWGPASWRILHGLTGRRTIKNPRLVSVMLTRLGQVLPCRYCRASFTVFMKEMPDVEEALRDGSVAFQRWLWEFHNKVNRKLAFQHYDKIKPPLDAEVKEALFKASLLPFEVLQKRVAITSPFFTRHDVFVLVSVILLNADTAEKRSAALSFLTLFAMVLRTVSTMRGPADRLKALADAAFGAEDTVFADHAIITLAAHALLDAPAVTDAVQSIIKYAPATTCKQGTCS